jgi:hypothetical protein
MKGCRGSLWELRLGITSESAVGTLPPNAMGITSESAVGTLPPNAMGITNPRRRRGCLMRNACGTDIVPMINRVTLE